MSKIHVKNQLNDGLTIEFCCGDKEYVLKYNEDQTIEVSDEDCMYFDIVSKPVKTLQDINFDLIEGKLLTATLGCLASQPGYSNRTLDEILREMMERAKRFK